MVRRVLLLAVVGLTCVPAGAVARVIGVDAGRAVVLEGGRVTTVAPDGARTPVIKLASAPRGAWAAGGRLALLQERSVCRGDACRYVETVTLGLVAEARRAFAAWSCETGERPPAPVVALGDHRLAIAASADCAPSDRIEVLETSAGTRTTIEAGGPVVALDTAGAMVAYATRDAVAVHDADTGAVVQELALEAVPARIAVGPDGTVAVLLRAGPRERCAAPLLVRSPGDIGPRQAGLACTYGLDVDGAGRPLALHRVGTGFGVLSRHDPGARPRAMAWLTLGPASPSPAPSFAASEERVALERPGCLAPDLSLLPPGASAPADPDVAPGCPARLGEVTLLATSRGSVRAAVAAECPRGCRGLVVLPDGMQSPLRLAAGERRLLRMEIECRPGRTVRFGLVPGNGDPATATAECASAVELPGTGRRPCARAAGKLPSWARARRMTVLNDSVLLSGKDAILRGFPCWQVRFIGRPALMLRVAEQEIRSSGMRVAPLVVIGIGYNSLWERNRANYARWAARFDGEANRLLATLRRAGAEQFVWVTLRRVTAANSPNSTWSELSLYRWYFPYVNERLLRLDEKRRRLVLARWDIVGAIPGVTYDSIHLDESGGRLMQQLIEKTIHDEAVRQAELVALEG